MAATCIQNPVSFNYAIQSIIRDILKDACEQHKDMNDRDQFVQAVFQSFVTTGGGEIIKQLVAIKHNPKHDIFKDEECKRTLEQDWFLFINQILNFGRPTLAVNGVFADVDQVNDDDGESTEFTNSFDYFLFQDIMKCRGLPTMPTHHQGRGNAIKIRHDLANLIIQNFVQTTFDNQIHSLKDLVNVKDQLMEENLELKRSMAAEADPAPKRPKVAPQAAPNGGALGAAEAPNGESNDSATAKKVEPEGVIEEEATVDPPAAAVDEEAAVEEEATVDPPAAVVDEEIVHECIEEVVTGAAKETNPWVKICDQHNTVMSNIKPELWLNNKKKAGKATIMKEFVKKLVEEHGGQPDMGMSLVRAIRDSSANVDSNLWDEPLFPDVTDTEPGPKTLNDIMGTLYTIIKDNWEKIQEALQSAK